MPGFAQNFHLTGVLILQKGPTAKFKPKFDGNFVESQAKERSLK